MIKTILIADDEPGQIATLEAFLKERGYTVYRATNGEDAFSKAVLHRPDLIILDIVMPKMDGTETALALKDNLRTQTIPIFFMTGVISPEDQVKVSENPNWVFAKPVRFHELLEAIRKIETRL